LWTPSCLSLRKLTYRQFADVVVAAPTGRIDHQNAAQLEVTLAPLVQVACNGKGATVPVCVAQALRSTVSTANPDARPMSRHPFTACPLARTES
jgi:hypothetical protein